MIYTIHLDGSIVTSCSCVTISRNYLYYIWINKTNLPFIEVNNVVKYRISVSFRRTMIDIKICLKNALYFGIFLYYIVSVYLNVNRK